MNFIFSSFLSFQWGFLLNKYFLSSSFHIDYETSQNITNEEHFYIFKEIKTLINYQ